MSNSRIYLNSNKAPGNMFYTDGVLDVSKVNQYPALLVKEPDGTGNQFAKVAHITNIIPGYKETVIQYTIDSGIAPVSNVDLEKYPTELRLGAFGLAHTCWDLCEVDLYKLLLQNQQRKTVSSKVFSLEATYAQDESLVSIMMPFNAEFDPVYSTLQEATTSIGFSCVRADDIWEHHTIIQDIVNIIARAKVVICDCSGKNPNVFYEAGIAHAIGKEVILITQSEQDVPFDLRHLRYIHYLSNNEGLRELSVSLQAKLRSIRGW
ncbi:hypothetical protein MNBD_GAMMA15-2237 [hydrothermal vent metagenome]|uniref:Nucleoside 2-deoxyribosyltransferase n=1 Tax=hydrothermal vent metagenome TaxID=652676 RepID=A0A3B0YDD8_9ZZZZ